MVLPFIIALLLIAGSTLVLLSGLRAVRASKSRLLVGAAFGAAVALGLLVGIRYGVFGDFQLSGRFRIQGAPIPLVLFVHEGQDWTDFVKPAIVGYPCMVANALFPAGLIGVLWVLAARLFQRSSSRLPT